ncbi:unnamed protein product [Scytosiphon promiscuus]
MDSNDGRDGGAPPTTDIAASPPPAATEVWQSVATNTVIGATGGALIGTVLATYRGHSVPFYVASMGTNFALASLAFFGTEAIVRKARGDKRDALGYAGAGLTTGVAMTFPIGGRYRAVVAGITMAGVGYGGFYAHRRARAYLDALGQEELRKREQARKKSLRKKQAGASGGVNEQQQQRQQQR